MEATKLLSLLILIIPNIMRILQHYQKIIQSDSITPEDKEEARTLLDSLKWKPFEDIK